MLDAEIGAERALERGGHGAAVGEPLGLPDPLQVGNEFIERRQERLGDANLVTGTGVMLEHSFSSPQQACEINRRSWAVNRKGGAGREFEKLRACLWKTAQATGRAGPARRAAARWRSASLPCKACTFPESKRWRRRPTARRRTDWQARSRSKGRTGQNW